jgi:hypothetical protein
MADCQEEDIYTIEKPYGNGKRIMKVMVPFSLDWIKILLVELKDFEKMGGEPRKIVAA